MMTAELKAHIEAENQSKRDWMEAGPNRWTGMYPTDEAHWAERNVSTVEDFERYYMVADMADLFKDAYHYHCDLDLDNMTTDEIKAEYDRACEYLQMQADQEAAEQALCVEKFEAAVANLIESGAGDRETALRWLREAERDEYCQHGDEYFEYSNGLPYGYLAKKEAA